MLCVSERGKAGCERSEYLAPLSGERGHGLEKSRILKTSAEAARHSQATKAVLDCAIKISQEPQRMSGRAVEAASSLKEASPESERCRRESLEQLTFKPEVHSQILHHPCCDHLG